MPTRPALETGSSNDSRELGNIAFVATVTRRTEARTNETVNGNAISNKHITSGIVNSANSCVR